MPGTHDPELLARRCWKDLAAHARRQGLSLRDLEQRLRRSRPPGKAPAHSTLHHWFTQRATLPDKLVFLALVRALELDEQQWGRHWEQWDHARSAPRSGDVEPGAVDPGDGPADPDLGSFPDEQVAEGTAGPTHGVRRLLVGVGVAGTAAVALLAVMASTRETDSGVAGSITIDCATVVAGEAPVFLEPAAAKPIILKRRGDPITLPHQLPEITGQDGRAYRKVLTPRTPSGSAYMPADTLTPSSC